VRRNSLAAVAAATAGCGGAARGDEVSADDRLCEHLLDWTDEVDDARQMAQLMTDEFWETFLVMHGQPVEATSKMRDRADSAN
jgi:hypothetical protein